MMCCGGWQKCGTLMGEVKITKQHTTDVSPAHLVKSIDMPADQLIKTKLSIRYIDARRLAQEAAQGLASGATEANIVEEACELFEDLGHEEQEAMKAAADAEPEWKRKALEQAERREREWEIQAARERQQTDGKAQSATIENDDETGAYGPGSETTTYTTVKRTSTTRVVPVDGGPHQVGTSASCCVVL